MVYLEMMNFLMTLEQDEDKGKEKADARPVIIDEWFRDEMQKITHMI